MTEPETTEPEKSEPEKSEPEMTEPTEVPAAPPGDGALYELQAVARRYQRGSTPVEALRGIDLEIADGEFLSIEGPSGSGKSTLLQLLGALDTPTTGTLRFDGHELTAASDSTLTRIRSEEIGFVFQQFNLIPTLTAAENVAVAMIPQHRSKPERRQRAQELLERVGLGARVEHLPSRLSGGEQQRVAIARALANEPRVVIADEPTGNLDSESAEGILDLLAEVRAGERPVTVVVATHDPDVAGRAGRRIRLRDGSVVEDTGRASV